MGYFQKTFSQILEFIRTLSPVRKISLGIISVTVVVGLLGVFIWAGKKNYQPLMTNLSPEDSVAIMRVLREKKIPFRVDASGKNIEIPPESVHDLRLELATMGLPETSVVGYELFDKQPLGTTSFVQKLNQARALEGELTRTIQQIKGVRRARVHLVTPKKTPFIDDQKKPTASVVLDLEPGIVLAEKQVYGIGNLVAKAVEGLDIADVGVVDSNGKMLSRSQRDPMLAVTADQHDFQRRLEEDMEKRISALLEPVLGEGHVVARVSAEIDFSQINETQTIYDADGSAIRSIQRDNASMSGSRPGPQGPAGVASNTPGQEAQPITDRKIQSDTKKDREITNYAVPQTIRQTRLPSGVVKKLSVAVLVDGKVNKTTDESGKVTATVTSWPPEKLKEFETLISSAVALDRKRGDVLDVKNMEFSHEDFESSEKIVQAAEKRQYVQKLMTYAIVALIIGLFFAFVVRPFIKWVTENTIESVDTFLPQTIEELEKLQKNQNLAGMEYVIPDLPEKIDPEKVEGEMIKEKIVALVDTHPKKAAMIIHEWVRAEKEKPKDASA